MRFRSNFKLAGSALHNFYSTRSRNIDTDMAPCSVLACLTLQQVPTGLQTCNLEPAILIRCHLMFSSRYGIAENNGSVRNATSLRISDSPFDLALSGRHPKRNNQQHEYEHKQKPLHHETSIHFVPN